MNRVLVSTGALIGRPNGRDFTLLKDIVPKLECDGLELLMYDSWYDKIGALKSTVLSLDMPVVVFHLEKQIGELISYSKLDEALERMEINCALARDIGANKLVLHLWNGPISDKNIDYNIKCFEYLDNIAKHYDLTLTVENVVCNQRDPFYYLCLLCDAYPDIKFTFDTKMADFHKQIDLIYDENNRHVVDHFAHLHINDRLGEYKDWQNLRVLHVGDGCVDFNKFFDFVKKINYKGDFTTEATSFDLQTGIVNIEKVNSTVRKIRELILY
ncbi:MAG: sugar phosphate isomerase/epimerase [Clostridia bacterium]|nr:sugar phosphate isomerase/epimerase [Clostridia bacterium]